jgi:hypothetical protein
VVKDFGYVHKNEITGITISNNNKWLFTCDFTGRLLQFDEGRFTLSNCRTSISSQSDYMVPLGINYFNFNRNINFLSSTILNHINYERYNMLREFIIEGYREINEIYQNVTMFSTIDILVMLYMYQLTGQDLRIPSFLKAIKSNPHVPRCSLNGLGYYIAIGLFGSPYLIGKKVVESMAEYQWRELKNFRKGTNELLEQEVIMTNCALDDSDREHLCKSPFF